jgi:hypothetical protein
MKAPKTLEIVKETFNIFKDGRTFNPMPQKFLLSALSSVLDSPETKERIRLNEAIGFFGHRFREMTKKIRPTEVEMIEHNGKIAAVNIIPAIRTKSVSVDEHGNVTHEQEFLDTDAGKAALGCYKSGTGGFSWAMSGSNGHNTAQGSVTKSFSGFDFVMQPNFIPLHRQQQLLSSMALNCDDLLLSGIQEQGVEQEIASALLSAFQADKQEDDNINELLLLNLVAEREVREQLLSSVIEKSPFFINESQRNALINCKTDNDINELNQLFSAMKNTNLDHLPHDLVKKSEKVRSGSRVMDYPSFDRQLSFK